MAAEKLSAVTLGALLAGYAEPPLPEIAVTGLALDSRKVVPGDAFFALPGTQGRHGLAHAAQAVSAGAVAVVWEPHETLPGIDVATLGVPSVAVDHLTRKLGHVAGRFFGDPSHALHCIGVTGTDGKTTVTHWIAQLMGESARPFGLLGTLGYGLPGQLQPASHTTPDAVRLQEQLARLCDAGAVGVAMEVSSHALHQHRVAGVHFDTAVLTHLSRDHLDYHGTQAAYADAKRELFRVPGLRNAVLNHDDAFGQALLRELEAGVRPLLFTTRPEADPSALAHDWLRAERIDTHARGLDIQVASAWGRARLQTKLLGRFNADNLLAAAAAAIAAGLSFEAAMQGIARVRPVPGRMEAFGTGRHPLVVVDYAHTPNALESVLRTLREHCDGELICLFGAGGDRDTGKRALMGGAAERNADRVVVTSDNPRTEDPRAIIDGILSGMRNPERARVMPDRAEAIHHAVNDARVGDVVLVAGKGHETWQEVGEERLPFSDREQVVQALKEGGA
jgi:UDP-N-acetylmuramoyl-L-alanyl-D-glutamate--2,6-diaminopimelate ligase